MNPLHQYVAVECEMRSGMIRRKFIRVDVLRNLRNVRHAEQCRIYMCTAFELDVNLHWFEGTAALDMVEPGQLAAGRREIDGYIWRGLPKQGEPVGQFVVCHDAMKYKEQDAEEGGYLRLGR